MKREYMEDFEEFEMEQIAKAISEGYRSGITGYGSTWNLKVNFDYNAAESLYEDEEEDEEEEED